MQLRRSIRGHSHHRFDGGRSWTRFLRNAKNVLDQTLRQFFLPDPSQKLDGDHIKIDLTGRALSTLMKKWVEVPIEHKDKSIIVSKEATANKDILLQVIAEVLECRLDSTRWGFALGAIGIVFSALSLGFELSL